MDAPKREAGIYFVDGGGKEVLLPTYIPHCREIRKRRIAKPKANMSSSSTAPPYTPFILLTDRFMLVPTPAAISIPAYTALYKALHASAEFCTMGFGASFAPRTWTDEETRHTIQTRDIDRSWARRGLGDFAVGMRGDVDLEAGRLVAGSEVRVVEGEKAVEQALGASGFASVEWVGYAGVRDATTTSMPERTPDDPVLPPWTEMIELRYGVAAAYWGKGVAGEAARAVMAWAAGERGVRRFIAETERPNVRSGRVLQKMGFRKSGTQYWKDEDEVEWERVVGETGREQ
jgi:RimJ/RimL family protein N-acetyltransferase